MSHDWNSIDPQWAWSPYEPDARCPWNRARAAHLFRRAGFGADSQQLDQAVHQSPQQVVDQLIEPPADITAFDQSSGDLVAFALATGDVHRLAAWWMHRMLRSPFPLQEKMTLFWHGHFATSAEKVADAELMYRQNQLFRNHALGDFRRLVHEVSRDPAMLIYLDSATNRKAHPNENYARELMELFTLGEGNYSEQDVQQLARCFTGWEIRRKQFRFNPYQNDEGEKTLFGQRGKFTGDEAVELVLSRPQVPGFIVRKLFRFFVADEPAPPDQLLQPLAEQFREEDLQLRGLLRRMLGSRLFFSDRVVGSKVRSPVDFAVTALRSLRATTNVQMLSEMCGKLGQMLFYPPNVKGWDGGRAWINSATLLGRANLVRQVLSDPATRFDGGGLLDVARRHGKERPEALVDWLAELLLAVPLSETTRMELVDVGRAAGNETAFREVLYLMMTLPEYQVM
ncbi:MAG: hypothetical protein KatS3mg110_3646 [Pirellulaceae bacterium]|nr:MAG: hypothetical protein KatS3mg110_3646 [Pirellulaceae bacterium]